MLLVQLNAHSCRHHTEWTLTALQHRRPVLAEEPVMRLEHAMLLMEDFLIVPQLLPRRDIRQAFKLAAGTGKMLHLACIHVLQQI